MSDEYQATPTRVCRRCSTQDSTGAAFCGACGTPFVRTTRRLSRRQLLAGVLVLVLVIGGVSGLLIKRGVDAGAREDAAAAARQQAADEAREAELVQSAADETERESRLELVTELEKNITKDAKDLVKDDLLEGPIEYTSCTATGGGSTDDLTSLTGTFECLAVNEERDDGTASGYSYRGTTDWQSGEITWQLGD